MRNALFGLIVLLAGAGQAQAQYYEERRPPPPEYYPRPGEYAPPPPRGYYEPPPPPPRPRVRFGQRCDALIDTGYGPQRLVCPIVEAKPLGAECACPLPRQPNFPRGGYAGGTTIR